MFAIVPTSIVEYGNTVQLFRLTFDNPPSLTKEAIARKPQQQSGSGSRSKGGQSNISSNRSDRSGSREEQQKKEWEQGSCNKGVEVATEAKAVKVTEVAMEAMGVVAEKSSDKRSWSKAAAAREWKRQLRSKDIQSNGSSNICNGSCSR